ncbi:hypothetical protein HpNP104_07100 [Helicobacter pylori]
MKSQIAKQESFGNFQKAAKLKEKLQKCKTIKANTRPASTTKKEAIDARLNPKLSTAKDVANLSHQAGMNAMQTGALIGGGVSLVTNVYECIANGKDPNKAIKHTTIATFLISGGAMAVVGQALIPIPVVGALIGGFVGAVLSETCFNALLKAREESKLARQRRIETEKECREIIGLLEAYQNKFNEVFDRYFLKRLNWRAKGVLRLKKNAARLSDC